LLDSQAIVSDFILLTLGSLFNIKGWQLELSTIIKEFRARYGRNCYRNHPLKSKFISP
jgi:hypothetical protein